MVERCLQGVKCVEAWQAQAKQDRASAELLLQHGNYGWAAFAYHQTLEKLLKAAYARRYRDRPPSGHNLLTLARGLRAARLPRPIREGLQAFTKYHDHALAPNGARPAALRRKPSAIKMQRDAERLAEWIQDEFDV